MTNSGVEKLLSNLNASKAADQNELSGKLLKATSCESAHILQVIFQLSLDTWELLADWKKALLTPVFKNASRIDPANYKTVSLTQLSLTGQLQCHEWFTKMDEIILEVHT